MPLAVDRAVRSFGSLAAGPLDSTMRTEGTICWRTAQTANGPATVRIDVAQESTEVEAWGPGAELLARTAAGLVGQKDRPQRLESVMAAADDDAVPPALRAAEKRHWATPLPRSDDVYRELVAAILGQRIAATDAARQWTSLCREYGGRAPGPRDDLRLPPDPGRLERVAYHELHRFGIERRRAAAVIGVARHFGVLGIGSSPTETLRSTADLELISGVGPWTAAVAGRNSLGDADAVPVGDFHLRNVVATALAGRSRGTDEEMLDLLAPYAGQRGRVLWWLALDGWSAPRFGPRRRNLAIADL